MSRIIDNEKEKMYDILNKEIPSADELAFASAYFNIRGFGLIKDAIKDKPMSFLVGRPQDESISFEEQIVRELEENEDDPEYFNLMVEAVSYFSDAARSIKKINGPFFHGKAYIGASPSLNSVKNGIGIVGSSNFTYAGLKTNSELNVVNTIKISCRMRRLEKTFLRITAIYIKNQWKLLRQCFKIILIHTHRDFLEGLCFYIFCKEKVG